MTAPRVAALVLAAGQSRRMGDENKLLRDFRDRPMVAHVVDTVRAAGLGHIVVATGHDAARVRGALADRDVVFAHNPDFASGMSSSLRAGLAALPEREVDGVLVCLGDMPWVRTDHLQALLAAFEPAGERPICVPVHDGRRGNPVLWPTRLFGEMQALGGDRGARSLLERHAGEVTFVEVHDDGIHRDVDSPGNT